MFTKPNLKSVTSAGYTTLALVAGAKIGDGLVAVMPDSVASYKKIIVGTVSLLAAASVQGKTPTAMGVQHALIGAGVKQMYDVSSDYLSTAVSVKDSSTVTNKFINAVVGHGENVPVAKLSAAWDTTYNQSWDRPMQQLQPAFSASSMM